MEKVKDIMTKDPACCTPETNLQEVARLMVEHDCGEIPVVDNLENKKPVGVITDRDICCRTVAEGKNPLEMTAQECMTMPCVTVSENDDVDACCKMLEQNQIRRVPVIDESGRCCGMVSQADLAQSLESEKTSRLVEQVSKPTSSASQVTQ